MRDEFEASLANNPFDLDLTYDTENMCYKDIRVAWVYYWLKEKSLEDVAKYIVNLEECLDYEIQS